MYMYIYSDAATDDFCYKGVVTLVSCSVAIA